MESIALAILAHAWISQVRNPPTVVNVVAWLVSVLLTALFLLRVIHIG